MTRKSKLVLKAVGTENFEIAKSVNTLQYGIPGDILSRKVVDRILIDDAVKINHGHLVVEFLKGSA